MADHIRIMKHEAVPMWGSFEVRFRDGRKSSLRPSDMRSGQLIVMTAGGGIRVVLNTATI
jgi:hypothetical protein